MTGARRGPHPQASGGTGERRAGRRQDSPRHAQVARGTHGSVPAVPGGPPGTACADKTPDQILFGNGLSHQRTPSTRDGWLVYALKRAREVDPTFPRVTPHDLRHTAASLAVSAGANVKALQRMLGHASAAMTLDVYAELFDDDLNSVAVALDQARMISSLGGMWANRVLRPR
ncbi:tyrosine-type recombinase/integrase [Cryobacterium sp. N21]|uniref:tyrosine-type recombinase/integrase n=1 Tax=Cryobacterium sp. N21 TaxID=2048289 RepID=UPI003518C9BB